MCLLTNTSLPHEVCSLKGGLIHYATWESAVYGFSHANELKNIRRQIFQQQLPYSKYKISRSDGEIE